MAGRLGRSAVAAAVAAYGAAAVWLRSRELDPHDAAREAAALARLPSLDAAQRQRVVRVEHFLNDDEVAQLLAAAEQLKPKVGRLGRDAEGNPLLGRAPWETWYLHTGGAFPTHCRWLHDRLLAAAVRADREEGWGLLPPGGEGVHFRTVELHEVTPGGALPDPKHFDGGSLVTLDLMLGEDFAGGGFHTLEADGRLQQHPFTKGTLLVFPSHKYHCVRPVSAGERRVLVAELWEGDPRTCAHRCTKRFGECGHTPAAALAERLVKGGGGPDLY